MAREDGSLETRIARWERRVGRERSARLQAEDLLEAKSRELYAVNQSLSRLASELEQRVHDRTRELAGAREHAVTLALRDQLTELPNRMCFGHVLEQTIALFKQNGQTFALFLIDFDNFKEINDTLGHEAGDVFLQGASGRLQGLLSKGDVIARLGGDEFAIIVSSVHAMDDLREIASDILVATQTPVAYRDQYIDGSCSLGIALFPRDAVEINELQRHADLALYKSKSGGRGRYTFFDTIMKDEFEARKLLGAELKQAIHANHVQPWFQPIVDSTTGRFVGVEALARWSHPKRGMLPPGMFLELAEERGLMGDLFIHMMRTACPPAKRWIATGSIQYLSINVSPSQFRSGTLVETVFRLIDELDFPPHALMIEITEELFLSDLARTSAQLEQLAKGGVRIALDDFGSGYSNIAYLRRLPIHVLKLDRLLIADICVDPKARSVLGAMVDIARALQLGLIVEGVETQAEAGWLSKLGCMSLQGYLFGKPMPESAFEALRNLAPPMEHVA